MNAGRPNRSVRAFTLLELVVATAMFATVISAVVTSFFAASRLRERNQAALALTQQIQQTVTFLKRDLRSATVPSTNVVSSDRTFESGGETEDESLTLSGEMATGTGFSTQDGSEFHFSTASGVLNPYEVWSPVQRVRYFLRTPEDRWSTNRGFELVRRVTRNLLSDTTTVTGIESVDELLLRNVRDLQFAFWNGESWLDYWDSTTLDPYVPEAVRASIELMPSDDERLGKRIEVVVPVSVAFLTGSEEETEETGGADDEGGGA